MANFADVEHGCTTDNCEGEGSHKTGLCPKCLNKKLREGWRVTRDGNLLREGVRITPGGSVTVQTSYNPRMMALMAGEISPEELDDEELAKGVCRNPDGKFPKRAPNHVPKAMYDRMTRELFARAEEKLRDSLVGAAESLAKMAADPEVDASTRLKAATWLYERLQGKAPTVVNVQQEKPFEVVLGSVHRGPRPPVAPASDMG